MIDSIDIIISFCLIIICSYFFQYISSFLRIPSVIFLIGTGIIIRSVASQFDFKPFESDSVLQVLGTIGLILIVLEGSLDLEVNRKKAVMIRNAFLNALFIFITTSLAITFILHLKYDVNIFNCFVYSIPLSTVSSAIAIPSATRLPKDKREFITFETSFSDIIGIMAFNFCFIESSDTSGLLLQIFISICFTLLAGIVFSFFLVYIVAHSKIKVKFFLIFSLLCLIYAVGKKFHLPSLFIVLVFGILLKNNGLFGKWKAFRFLIDSRISEAVHEIEFFTVELAFVIRTFFFILFGYSINFDYFYNTDVWISGSIILLAILFFRFMNMKLIYHSKHIFPEIFIAPRGLITVLLFYSIPSSLLAYPLDPGIIYFVVLASNIIMMLAMLFYGNTNDWEQDQRHLDT